MIATFQAACFAIGVAFFAAAVLMMITRRKV